MTDVLARTPAHDGADRLLRQAVADGDLPAVVAMATTKDRPVYEAAFSGSTGTTVTPDSVFWIASMSKAIVSVAAMQLVEQGTLHLDGEVGPLVPDLASPDVLEGFSDDGRPILRPARRPITLRHLLTHTSGHGYAFADERLLRFVTEQEVPDITTCTRAAFRLPLMFDPGDRWQYGIGTDWLGQVIEAASGQGLEEYLTAHILAPLGMDDTSFTLSASQRERLVPMFARLPDGSLQQIPFELPQNPEFAMAGGGLYGTPRDYLRFLRMLLNEGELDGSTILAPETIRLIAQNHIGELPAGRFTSANPQLTNDFDLFPEMTLHWGLGFLINPVESAQGRSAGSLTWAGLGNTYFWVDRTRQLGGLIMTQILPFADPRTLDVLNRFEAEIYDTLDA